MSEPLPSRPLMGNGKLYCSPTGIRSYQAEAAALAYYTGELLVTFDYGVGKTMVGIALAGELYEAGEIDLVMLIGQRNKIADRDEHPAEWAKFCSLSQLVYHGPSRAKRLAKSGIPEVFMTTYETGASELMRRVPGPGTRGKGKKVDGPLVETLGLRHKRTLWIFDEVSVLSNRSAERYRAYEYLIGQLRKSGHRQWTIGLTANSMKTDYEDSFNQARIVTTRMPAVGVFESEFSRGRDAYDRLVFRRDKEADFARLFQDLSYRKRFTDPDVQAEIPALVEKTVHVDLEPAHRQLYEAVGQMYDPQRDQNNRLPPELAGPMATALRLTAGHPASHLHSTSALSRAIVDTIGQERLRAIPSSKSKRLIEDYLLRLRDQGSPVLLFTAYAETVLPELVRDLRAAGLGVATYTGGQSETQNRQAKQDFRASRVDILLCSDAGSKGLNLPEAHYVIEYEPAQTVETREQRFGRATRLGSGRDFVYALTTLARATLDVASHETVTRRTGQKNLLLGQTREIG